MSRRKNLSPKKILVICICIIIAVYAINTIVAHAGEVFNDEIVVSTDDSSAQIPPVKKTQTPSKTTVSASDDKSVALELPKKIRGEIMLNKKDFVVSFNPETNCPNYVAWHLTRARATNKTVDRKDWFEADPEVPAEHRVEHGDYSRSNYDRGHMCPSADNRHDAQAMIDCFYMTNMCPQTSRLNRGDWNDLEEACRQWAKDYDGVYIACGPIYDSKTPQKIGTRRSMKIAVPTRFFKVVLMMGRIPKAIGFIMNNNDDSKDLYEYAVSVDEVEKITGIDFFYLLDKKTQREVESKCSPAAWNL